MWQLIGSPGYPAAREEQSRDRAGETFDRGVSASGVLRQMMAILTQPNRSPRLRALRMPTLVVHGLADKMVHVSGGRATAAAIPGAELLLIDGMGHDLPPELYETFADAIATATRDRPGAGEREQPAADRGRDRRLGVELSRRAARRSRCRTRARCCGSVVT